jgi:DNA-binding XRE family transcriptional regulator
MLELPTLKALASEKGDILALAAQVLPTMLHTETDPTSRARMATRKALENVITSYAACLIEPALQSVLDFHEAMNGERGDAADAAEWDAQLDVAVDEELANVRTLNVDFFNKFAIGVRLYEPGRPHEVAKELGLMVALSPPYNLPLEDTGKLLSAVGIAKKDLEGLATMAGAPAGAVQPPGVAEIPPATQAPPPPPTQAPPPPPTQAPPPPPTQAPPPPAAETDVVMPPVLDIQPPPGPADIAKAYALMYQAAGPDANDMAHRLGISRNTFVNWCTGKSQPKCTLDQARFLHAYSVKAAADLQAAADIFARVR